MEVSGHLYTSAALLSGEETLDTHLVGGSEGPRAGLDDTEK
jgi:hypothetical protein